MIQKLLIGLIFLFSQNVFSKDSFKSEKDYLKDAGRKIEKDCSALLMQAVLVNQSINKARKTKHILFDRKNVHKKLYDFHKIYNKGENLSSRLIAYDKQQSLNFFKKCRKILKSLHNKCKKHWNDTSAIQYCSSEQVKAEMLPYLQSIATPSRAKIPKLPKRAN